jgi:N-acyl amino acid synthase FeeM
MDVHCARCVKTRQTAPQTDSPPLQCVAARRRPELKAAFQLVYDRYYRDGLATWNRFGLRILPHQLLDSSWVLLAKRARACLGTLSLIEDGAMGLPLEQLYPAEIWQLRRRQTRVAELACFALQDQSPAESMTVLRALLQSACEIAFRRQIDALVICVHPRRVAFYNRRLGFDELGPLRICPWVCDQPAVAMKLTLQAGSRTTDLIARRGSYSERFVNATRLQPLQSDDRIYFRRLHLEVAHECRQTFCAA